MNGSGEAQLGAFSNGDYCCIACDFTDRIIWFRRNNGNWDNSATDNPATGTGGYSFSALTGPFYALSCGGSSNAVTISGFTVPALSTRRAETEVELRDGQSFAISGLLDHRTTENLSRVPGIASIPILGQLFRSRNINHSVVELVVIVRARVVDPITATEDPHQPVWAVPNMTEHDFDKQLHHDRPKDVPTEPQPQPIQYRTQPETAK